MNDMLALCTDRPRRAITSGEVVIDEAATGASLIVVVSGSFDVVRADQIIAVVDAPGAVLGEMSVLLGRPATARVVASQDGEVVVVDDPLNFLAQKPQAIMIVAQTLAARLDAATAYLSDLARQYGADDGNLGLIGSVLSSLTSGELPAVEPGSSREPDPEY